MQRRALIVAPSPTSALEVARCCIDLSKFERVSLLCPTTKDLRLKTRLEELAEQGVQCISSDPTRIDFGLVGAEFLALREETTDLIVCGLPRVSVEDLFGPMRGLTDLEAAVPIRMASEVVEFITAPGPKLQVAYESSLMVFGSSELDVTESDFQVSQSFQSALHESLAVAEKIVRSVSKEHRVHILRAAPVVGRLQSAELYEGNGFTELVRRLSLTGSSLRMAARGTAIKLESIERVSWALTKLLHEEHGGTYHLLDDDDFTDEDLLEWLAIRFDVPSPLTNIERRAKFLDQWTGLPGAEVTFGNQRRYLKSAGATIFEERLVSNTERYLDLWLPRQ